jgi:hypothetical protein
MKSLLEKLDRKAKHLLDNMDSHLQQPTVQILTGDVFTHDTTGEHDSIRQESPIQPISAASETGAADSKNHAPSTRKLNQGSFATTIRQRA